MSGSMVPGDMEDRMMQRTVAITGGHGVLGRAVLEAALKGGWQVAVIDHASGHAVPDGCLLYTSDAADE